MDRLDHFNSTISEMVLNWRNVVIFVAAIFLVGTVFHIAGDPSIAWLIISWVIVAIIGWLFFKPPKALLKKEDTGF